MNEQKKVPKWNSVTLCLEVECGKASCVGVEYFWLWARLLPAVWPLRSYLTSLGFSFFTHKMETMTVLARWSRMITETLRYLSRDKRSQNGSHPHGYDHYYYLHLQTCFWWNVPWLRGKVWALDLEELCTCRWLPYLEDGVLNARYASFKENAEQD